MGSIGVHINLFGCPVFIFTRFHFALAGGVLFGPVHGSIYSLIAATIGATAAFFIARYITSKWVVKKVDNKLKKITAGVNAAGWRFVAFIRLVPLIPFNLANYALGLTNIKASHYIAASFVCMAPGAIVYSYLGYAGREILGGGKSQLVKILFALSFFAAFSLLPGLVKRFFPTEAGTFIDQEKS